MKALNSRNWPLLLVLLTSVLAGYSIATRKMWSFIPLLFPLFWAMAHQPYLIVVLALLNAGTVGAYHRLGGVSVAGVQFSAYGVVNLLIGYCALLALLRGRLRRRSLREFAPFLVFAGVMVVGWLYSPYKLLGMKDLMFIMPVLLGLVTKQALHIHPKIRRLVEKALIFSLSTSFSVLALLFILGKIRMTERGPESVAGPRSVALFLLPILSYLLACWRYNLQPRERRHKGIIIGIVLALILITLSRMPIFIAFGLLLPFAWLKVSTGWRVPLASIIGLLLVGTVISSFEPLRARFFFDSNERVALSNLTLQNLNTQGRDIMWASTWDSAIQSPLWGHGLGTSRKLMLSTVSLEHPHNDYLKVLHDLGLLGLLTLLYSWIGRLVQHWQAWNMADRAGQILLSRYHMAAFLATLSVVISFITDNTLVYTFVLIPVFVLFAIADHADMQFAKMKAKREQSF